MSERFLTKTQAAEMLGLPERRVQELMRKGAIRSIVKNPKSRRKQYLTTPSAISAWQAGAMTKKPKAVRMLPDDDLFEIDRNGNLRIKRKKAPAAGEAARRRGQ